MTKRKKLSIITTNRRGSFRLHRGPITTGTGTGTSTQMGVIHLDGDTAGVATGNGYIHIDTAGTGTIINA